ncbi:MAG TPA: zf-HC2 domain-containing protein [Jatrophihabitans sp.]|nr:zf-HC2 domain-containing protein [Jatrophihabitans sp.]
MNCERYREAASARLDGEPLPMPAAALDAHLAACTDCAGWLATVERAGRALRVTGLTPPDLSGEILQRVVLPANRLARRQQLVRAGLAALGFVQWALAMPALFGHNPGVRAGMSMGAHAAHESAAWNLAMGVAFLAVAVKPARAVGTLPILGTFVGVLAVLSVPDLLAGAVSTARLASHAGVLAGLVLVALISRWARLPAPRPVTADQPTGDAEASVDLPRSRGAAGRRGGSGRRGVA